MRYFYKNTFCEHERKKWLDMLRYDLLYISCKTPMGPILGVASLVGIYRKSCDEFHHYIPSSLYCIAFSYFVIPYITTIFVIMYKPPIEIFMLKFFLILKLQILGSTSFAQNWSKVWSRKILRII